MSASRLGKNWADVDEDDEDEVDDVAGRAQAARFETPADADGIKQVIEYKERDGKTYKVSTKVRVTNVTKWTNKEMAARKTMEKFGKVKNADPKEEANHCQRSNEEINIEVCRRQVQITQTNDGEDKFLEEALKNCENLFKEKKVWTDINRDKQIDREEPAAAKPADGAAPAADAAKPDAAAAPGGAKTIGAYVPPSLRGGGKGTGKDNNAGQEASLRITNLSEDAKEGDLQDLFGGCGRLQRVYLAKDPNTHLSRGFAFVTYYEKRDAQKAIDKLNGHGYDNLIMQVQWAKPRA